MELILRKSFTASDTWDGGFYELAIELGPRLEPHADERLQAALEAIWQFHGIDGCYEDRQEEPSNQPRQLPSLEVNQYGVATLPDGQKVVCGIFIVREDDLTGRNDGSDWIGFYLPMGALDSVYDVGAYPFGDAKSSYIWREPLDDWLMNIGAAVFAKVPFPLALIGHEISGTTGAAEISRTGIPVERWIGYLWRENEHLIWYRPTRYEADFMFNPAPTPEI